ncbi:MAG: c-type cytochrome [Pseudomonadota bacterium]
MYKHLTLIAALMALGACGATEDAQEAATPTEVETVDTNSNEATIVTEPVAESVSATPPAAVDDPVLKRGRIVWFQCRSCHTLKEGDAHLTGPNLYGLFGRQAGGAEGFGYSDPLLESNIVWDAETLDPWLERPDQFIEGNVMAYAGLRRPADREAVIAYLLAETQ